MNLTTRLALVPFLLGAGSLLAVAQVPGPDRPVAAAADTNGSVVLSGPTNALLLRLFTDASPEAAHLFNTFDLEAFGQTWLQSPGRDRTKHWLTEASTNAWMHNIMVDGAGPQLASTNGMKLIERASGRDWRYLAMDVSAAYRGRLDLYRRGILYIEPDLFIIHDHFIAGKPAVFQMVLHPPAATVVDSVWKDLRLDLPGKGGMQINAPSRRHQLRAWEKIESTADSILPGTVTMRLGPTAALDTVDIITVFAIYRPGEKKDYAFKFLESDTAVGARIHRAGLPTLVAFRTDPKTGTAASLTGFPFNGPVGVDAYRPKVKESKKESK